MVWERRRKTVWGNFLFFGIFCTSILSCWWLQENWRPSCCTISEMYWHIFRSFMLSRNITFQIKTRRDKFTLINDNRSANQKVNANIKTRKHVDIRVFQSTRFWNKRKSYCWPSSVDVCFPGIVICSLKIPSTKIEFWKMFLVIESSDGNCSWSHVHMVRAGIDDVFLLLTFLWGDDETLRFFIDLE